MADCPKHNFVWNKFYKTELINKNNLKFVSGMIYEDMWFTPDILEVANSVVAVPNTYYHYWKHQNSLIKGDCDKYRADKLLGHKYLIEKCKKHNVIPFQKNELQYKNEYKLLGLLFLKEYAYRATRKFYLFGLVPIFEITKNV